LKKSNLKSDLWISKSAAGVTSFDRLRMLALIFLGGITTIVLMDWWFKEEHINNIGLFILLSLVFWWGILRMVLVWISYLAIRKPASVLAPKGKKVAIFTTSSPGEPISMFEKTLEACSKISYPHTTYLLDDTQNPDFKQLAERHGAVWLELVGIPGAKAGKINAALELTDEEFILVLDPDHIPFPNFLDEVLGFFTDENVGFVQVAQAYYNQYRSFTAKGAAEQTYGFYGPTQMGLHGLGSPVAIGANCTFRRKALESIGGHGIGLAEDLVTSIRIHAKGWKSVYHPVVVSRGLVPEEFSSFCKQQLKWSRGVHEVLFDEIPRHWKNLNFLQRLTYLSIGTYYISGLSMLIFVLLPFLYLWFGVVPANMDFTEFVINWLPLAISGLLIYLFAQKWLSDKSNESGLHWKGMVLKFSTWPVFLLGFVLSILNKKIPYIPTSKQSVKGFSPFMWPLLINIVFYIITVIFTIIDRVYFTPETSIMMSSGMIWGMVTFATIAFVLSFTGFFVGWSSRKMESTEPWFEATPEHIKIK
jgi:cellulose synthase (UDP-forming)